MLNRICEYKEVYIQCHNVPDADSIGASFALEQYLATKDVSATIVYGGHTTVTKPNLLLMIDKLGIKLDHVSELPKDCVIVTIDCQYGAGNAQFFECKEHFIIDHHRAEVTENANTYIHPSVGSCCTLVWQLLKQENFILPNAISTALYYGLYTDTNNLTELYHPLDKDMLDDLTYDIGIIKLLKNTVLSMDELKIASIALAGCQSVKNIGLLEATACDPNILGYISDLAQQVDSLDAVVSFSVTQYGIKLSIRSAIREIMASELAGFIVEGIGSGGGNVEKAGGFIPLDKFNAKYNSLLPARYIHDKLTDYAVYYDYIYSKNYVPRIDSMQRCTKLKKPVGYAKTTDIFPLGTELIVRTLEGDISVRSGDDTYIMIGILGEVYPIKAEKFNTSYTSVTKRYSFNTEYVPTVIDRITGIAKKIAPFAYECTPSQTSAILAMPLLKPTKVFANWNTSGYFYGSTGDILACRADDYNDIYIIRRDIFDMNYIADSINETLCRICILVPFIMSHSKQEYPPDIGISLGKIEAMYSSAQHDTLEIDYHSFWYITESGEKQEFLNYESFASTFNQAPIKEIPDADALDSLSRKIPPAKVGLVCRLLEKMFVCVEHGLTVDQYIHERREYWRPLVEKRSVIEGLQNDIVRCYFAKHIDSADAVHNGYGLNYPALDFKVTYGEVGYWVRFYKAGFGSQYAYRVHVETETQRFDICSFYVDATFSTISISKYNCSKSDEVIDVLTLAVAHIKEKE